MEIELKNAFFHGSSRRSTLYGKPLSVLALYKKRIGLVPISLRSVFYRSTLTSHHTSSNSIWIDIILVDNSDTVVEHPRSLPPFPSRHDIICATIDVFEPSLSNSSYTYRSYGKITPQVLSALLTVEDWSFFSLPDEEFEIEQSLAFSRTKCREPSTNLPLKKRPTPANPYHPGLQLRSGY